MKNTTIKLTAAQKRDQELDSFGGMFASNVVKESEKAEIFARSYVKKMELEAKKSIKETMKKFASTISLGKKILTKRSEFASKKASRKEEKLSTYDYLAALGSTDPKYISVMIKIANEKLSLRKKERKTPGILSDEILKMERRRTQINKGEKEIIATSETKITKLDEVVFDPDAPIAETFAQEIGAKFGSVKDPTFIKNYGEDTEEKETATIKDSFIETAAGYFVKIPNPTDNISIEKTSSETFKSFVKRAEEAILSMVYKTVGQEDLLKVKRIVKFSHLKKGESLPSKHFFNNPTLYPWLEKFNQVIVGARQQATA